MFSLEFPLIDGQNDTIGNWNFTLEKFFHNTSIIYQIFTVTISIIGSSSYTNGKFLSSNILQSIFNFLSAIFEVTERERGMLKLASSAKWEEEQLCRPPGRRHKLSSRNVTALWRDSSFLPSDLKIGSLWMLLLIAQPDRRPARVARVSESDVYLIANCLSLPLISGPGWWPPASEAVIEISTPALDSPRLLAPFCPVTLSVWNE